MLLCRHTFLPRNDNSTVRKPREVSWRSKIEPIKLSKLRASVRTSLRMGESKGKETEYDDGDDNDDDVNDVSDDIDDNDVFDNNIRRD